MCVDVGRSIANILETRALPSGLGWLTGWAYPLRMYKSYVSYKGPDGVLNENIGES